MSLIFALTWVLSAAFTLLIGAGVVTYIRRTWQLIRSHSDESVDDRLLDGIDQIQTQLYRVNERLSEVERLVASQRVRGPSTPSSIGSGHTVPEHHEEYPS